VTTEVVKSEERALPAAVVERGIDRSQWRVLFNLFPSARPDSALMVWDYCKARGLDPMKKPCHIVPMKVKGADGQWGWRDVVMPGIYEYRITAQRTGLYLGHTEPEYGDPLEHAGVKAPAWCAMTFYRWNDKAREKVPFPVKVWFAEVVATKGDGQANERWTKAPIQMLTKCTEAAGLREAFPEEFGGEPTAEEMDGRAIVDDEPAPQATTTPQPAQRKSQQQNGGSAATSAPPSTHTTAAAAASQPAAPAPASPPATPAEAPKDAPAYIGTIAALDDRGGTVVVKLNTGFRAVTNQPEMIGALKGLKESGALIEIVTRAHSKPGNLPVVTEIQPVEAE
jgi:phage recombination protein Bet